MEKNVRVVVCGIGNVGSHFVRLLSEKKGVEMVGIVDIDPKKIGTDAGILTGTPIGITITGDLVKTCQETKPDLVVSMTTPTTARRVYEEMIPVIEMGIDVLVPNMGTSNLWISEPELAAEIDAKCKQYGVSYLGIGATQVQDRFILANTEGCSKIDKITFTHYADMHAFSDESISHEWGVTLSEEDYWNGIKNGTVESHDYFKDGIWYLGAHLGWKIDDVTMTRDCWLTEDKKVWADTFKCQGFQNGVCKIETNWVFCRDPEQKYYDRVIVDGTPHIDSMNNYSPDRGLVSTFAALANGIPAVLKAAPGYVNTLTVPACTLIDNEYYKHI